MGKGMTQWVMMVMWAEIWCANVCLKQNKTSRKRGIVNVGIRLKGDRE